jgi:hypothetical protein
MRWTTMEESKATIVEMTRRGVDSILAVYVLSRRVQDGFYGSLIAPLPTVVGPINVAQGVPYESSDLM